MGRRTTGAPVRSVKRVGGSPEPGSSPGPGAPSSGTGLAPPEQPGLLGLVLLLGDRAAVAEVGQALQLLGHRRRRLLADAPLHAHGEGLRVLVDHLLDVLRVADVAELVVAALARRLEREVAGADHPLEHPLVEPDVLQTVERDLHGRLGDQALAVDDALVRDDEVRGRPPDQRPQAVGDENERPTGQQGDQPGGVAETPVRELRDQDGPRGEDQHGHDDGADQGDPVRPEVEDQLLVRGQETLRECHARTVTCRPPTGKRSSGQRRWRTSPNPTATRSPAAVSTTSEPSAATSVAVPSTARPSVVVARTRRPIVAQSGRYRWSVRSAKVAGSTGSPMPPRNPASSGSASMPPRPAAPSTVGGGAAMLIPTPTTTCSIRPPATAASARIPPTLASPRSRSFGHLHATSPTPFTAQATAIEAPARSVRSTARSGGSGGRSTTENSSESPGVDSQVRPSRPRPANWWPAATSVHSGAPRRARASAVAFVESVSSSHRTLPSGRPADRRALRSACSFSCDIAGRFSQPVRAGRLLRS